MADDVERRASSVERRASCVVWRVGGVFARGKTADATELGRACGGEIAAIRWSSTRSDAGPGFPPTRGARRECAPCLRRSEIGPACFALDGSDSGAGAPCWRDVETVRGS
ncbi:hypothetical protein JI435_419850 [Parastagonospora nodorum SN15]|uniref:Uncharacterized protein n=1 Tax=Phaeosphaeria nodorum (strain SN15 / ATCC MYA-4574 / FGSC 10173) TaxID=321614 RepID=A0A7U2I6J7_PHANO|nr:hypothetical protein HBH54_239090 [Parastagonospora nodorum]QRD03574.1 hypothetical protein JI435_419850 [Parastagonospora nodorum SN15]KAH4048634.1 hypothetical protein HBH49_149260 [Parastagonospora nodorum]KAH4584714.1 hypothetical protein HBH84_014900 [Parastagonospora nodorum]KAH4627588.1 hypothetical protein HBH55_112540 [Parastagonospora nodorum]